MTVRNRVRALAWTLFALAVALTGWALSFTVRSIEAPTNAFGFRGAFILLTLSFAAVGLMLASRRHDNPIGWIFLGIALSSAIQSVGGEYTSYALITGAARGAAIGSWLDSWIWVPLTGAIAIHVFLLFPTGHLPSPRWRLVAWTGALGTLVFAASFILAPQTEAGLRNPFFDVDPGVVDLLIAVGSMLYLVSLLASVASLVVRFRRATGDERQQLRWLASVAAVIGVFLVMVFLNEFFFGDQGVFARVASMGLMLAFAAVPFSVGLAVLKYRLYDLDVVISRAVLYGGLVAIITLFYVGLVVGIGALVGRRGNLFLSIAATAIIALAFQPLRERVRRLANRVVYGRRATPYEVLSEFSAGIAGRYSAEEVLPRMARLLSEGTGGETAVWVHVDDELRLAASWPDGIGGASETVPTGTELPEFEGWDCAYPVRHRGELLGALTIRKPPQEPLTGAEEKLVDDVADQAGLVLGNVRLIEELRASRQRLVSAQDEERRRLERDIHDGAQQQLVAMSVKLRLARTLSAKDPAKAAEMLDQLQAENQETLETLRDLARGIYPPLLADRGLAAALEAQGRKGAIPVEVSADGTGRYPQEVEAAAYFCCLEAIQNVAKYAEASRVRIRLWTENGVLAFSVEDDGRGFDRALTRAGSGLRNMGDRVDALGGTLEIESAPGEGTTVTGRIPAQALAAAQASESRSGSNSDLGM